MTDLPAHGLTCLCPPLSAAPLMPMSVSKPSGRPRIYCRMHACSHASSSAACVTSSGRSAPTARVSCQSADGLERAAGSVTHDRDSNVWFPRTAEVPVTRKHIAVATAPTGSSECPMPQAGSDLDKARRNGEAEPRGLRRDGAVSQLPSSKTSIPLAFYPLLFPDPLLPQNT